MLSRSRKLGLAVTVVMLFAVSCSREEMAWSAEYAHHKFVLVGSTACHDDIKTRLGIPSETKCDFIRWNLGLDQTRAKTFTLDINYGEAQANTKGFVAGGLKMSAAGTFQIETIAPKREVYRLKSDKVGISLVKLTPNLFQLMTADGAMMIGNGGWSYTLNRAPAVVSHVIPATIGTVTKASQAIFDGRTPCRELAIVVAIPADIECFKLKWRITLNRDATSLQPTTFTMETTLNRRETIEGRWSEGRLGEGIVYRLAPDSRAKAFSLLVGDDNVLFFLDSNDRLLTGNEDFSFTLNRKS